MKKLLTPGDLRQFTGTDNWYRHGMGNLIYTDGVKHFAEEAGAYWFTDIVASVIPLLHAEDFVHIIMTVKDGKAMVIMNDGGKGGKTAKVLYKQKVDYTDCPEGIWEFYLEGNVLLVPSEH